jgi:hypothetical protein
VRGIDAGSAMATNSGSSKRQRNLARALRRWPAGTAFDMRKAPPEHEQMAGERILPQYALHQHGEPVDALAGSAMASSNSRRRTPTHGLPAFWLIPGGHLRRAPGPDKHRRDDDGGHPYR